MHRDQPSIGEQRVEEDGGAEGARYLVRRRYGKLCQAAATSSEAEEGEDKEKSRYCRERYMAVEAEDACIHGTRYDKAGGGVGQAGGGTEHPRARGQPWQVWTTGRLAPLEYRVA